MRSPTSKLVAIEVHANSIRTTQDWSTSVPLCLQADAGRKAASDRQERGRQLGIGGNVLGELLKWASDRSRFALCIAAGGPGVA
jgi:hypothetical protein